MALVEFIVYSIQCGRHFMVHGRSNIETLHQEALRVFSGRCYNETHRRSVLCGEWMVDYLVGGSNYFKVCYLWVPFVGPTVPTYQQILWLRVDQGVVEWIGPENHGGNIISNLKRLLGYLGTYSYLDESDIRKKNG